MSYRKMKWKAILCGLLLAGCIFGEEKIAPEIIEGVNFIKEKKIEEAEKVFQSMTKKNDKYAYHYLGVIYLQHKQDLKKGIEYHKKASELGNLDSQYLYALALSEGYGVTKDVPEAIRLLKDIADRTGYKPACYQTGRLMLTLSSDDETYDKVLPYLEKACEQDEDFYDKGCATIAPLLAGTIYMEKKDYQKAFVYLEYSAMGGTPEAWGKLGVMYADGMGLQKENYERAKLCFLKKEQIKPHPETEFNIGLMEAYLGNQEESLKWMKLAASKKYQLAEQFLKDKESQKEFFSGDIKKETHASEPLKEVIRQSFLNLGKIGTEIMDNLEKLSPEKQGLKLIRLPQPENIRMNGWVYDAKKTEQKLRKNLQYDRKGNLRWATSKFNDVPLEIYLASQETTIAKIHQFYYSSMIDFLSRSVYRRMDQKSADDILKTADPELLGERIENQMWQIKPDLYFNISLNHSQEYMSCFYQFILTSNDDAVIVYNFCTPPSIEDADMVQGIAIANMDCINNYAVKLTETEKHVFLCEQEQILEVFDVLVSNKHAAGIYNLAVYYQNLGKKDLADKYYKLAKELKEKKK